MTPIICKNDLNSVIDRIQDYLQKNSTIKEIKLVDQSEDQIVLLVSDHPISQDAAAAWWNGFCAALEKFN